jgi:hypothetical protein
VRNLHEFQLRLVNNAATLPSGLDISNTLKYFSQTLLGESCDQRNTAQSTEKFLFV